MGVSGGSAANGRPASIGNTIISIHDVPPKEAAAAEHTTRNTPAPAKTADDGGFWQYQDTNTVGLDRRFYRLSYP
jgi:hypothetical protein